MSIGEKPQHAIKPAPDDPDISAGESDADHGRWVGLVLFMVVTSMVVSVLAWILARRLGVDG